MAKKASREVIESFGAFLRRSTVLSDDDIRVWMQDLDEGRMRTPDSSSEAFRRALVLPSAEATRIPNDGSPKNGQPSVPSGATKLEGPTAGRGPSSGSGRLNNSLCASVDFIRKRAWTYSSPPRAVGRAKT